MRALRERVVSAAGIIEDGIGGTQGARANLVDEYTKVALAQLRPDRRRRRRSRSSSATRPAEFKTLRAAVKLPPRPDYYAEHMDLSIVVDRGDVWYDLPFDADGHFKPQPAQDATRR